ncbi:MAG TPA: YCF48-related protein [Pyrinomonadaceae bacterium]|nr:YCF48-related protein [Pyrinomonadaceae bacterium]
MAFIDRKHGWAVNDKGEVWRSDDGGKSWIAISKLAASGGDDWQFNSAAQLEFNDDRNGWILETLSIWRTSDGGANWRKVFPPSSGQAYVKGQPTRGSFLNSKNVWVSGTSGEVYETKDGAETWRIQTVLPNGDFTDVYFLDGQTGWLLGYVGGETGSYVYQTIDAGHSWSRYPIAGVQIKSICFISENEGWAVGSQATSAEVISGVLLRTEDGGRSWNRIDLTTEERSFDRVHFVDTQHGWLFGRKNLYQSDDGGKAWRIVRSLEPN